MIQCKPNVTKRLKCCIENSVKLSRKLWVKLKVFIMLKPMTPGLDSGEIQWKI